MSGDLADVGNGFKEAGVEQDRRNPDVAVVTAPYMGEAVAADATAVAVIGSGGSRNVRRRWPHTRRFIALPDAHAPQLMIPVDRPSIASYAIRNWWSGESRLQRLRNGLAPAAMKIGVFPDLSRSVTLGLPSAQAPFVVGGARAFGIPDEVDWFLTLGLGDVLTRAVFHVFPRPEPEPRWVVKFARVAGYADPFSKDERGLSLVADAGGSISAHAPRLIGRFDVAGLPASIEEAAVGRRLTYLLQTPGHRVRKLRAIDAVAEWIVEVGRQTAAPGRFFAPERNRLRTEVILPWRAAGVSEDLVDLVPEVPAVLQHNDLGCWNIVIGRHGFTAVDWESARRYGLPLWDLVYFLVDALVHLDGAWDPRRRETHAARLLRGELPSSAILFRWIEAAVDSLGITPSSVGPIVTLGWLHHGLSHVARQKASDSLVAGPRSTGTYGEWMVRLWLRDPCLGPRWSAWSGG